MTDKLPKVSIVVLNWNSWQDTVGCLDSLLAVDYLDYEVVIVDNSSQDRSVEEITRWLTEMGLGYTFLDYSGPPGGDDRGMQKEIPAFLHRHITLIETGKNLGYGGGNNVGIRHGLKRGADYVLVLNDDTRVSKDFLSKMVETAEKDPHVGLVGCKVCALDDPSYVLYQGGHLSFWLGLYGFFPHSNSRSYDGEVSVNFVPGCAFLIKREVLDQIALFEERYFLYADDVELCYRAQQAGWGLRVNPNTIVWHPKYDRFGKRPPYYYYYTVRNALYFISERLRGLQKLSCLIFFLTGRALLVALWVAQGKRRHIKAVWLGLLDYLHGVGGEKKDLHVRLS